MSADTNKEAFKSLVILIADSRSYTRALLRAMLLQLGIKFIYEADYAATALNFISTVNMDIIFLDWDMPVCGAQEIVCTVRTSGGSTKPNLPIIGISSIGQSARVHEAIGLGVSDFVVRPLSPKILEQRLLRVVFNARNGLHTSGDNRKTPSQA